MKQKSIKYLLIISIVLLASSCAVPSGSPQWQPPFLHRLQKVGQTGSTNMEQRRDDAMVCGAMNRNDNLSSILGVGPGETIEMQREGSRKWKQCMADKGYILIGECGKDRKTSICR